MLRCYKTTQLNALSLLSLEIATSQQKLMINKSKMACSHTMVEKKEKKKESAEQQRTKKNIESPEVLCEFFFALHFMCVPIFLSRQLTQMAQFIHMNMKNQ